MVNSGPSSGLAPRRRIPIWYALNRWVLGLLVRSRVSWTVEGREHEPPAPYLVIANHTSVLDIPLVGVALREPIRFMGKHELGHNRLVGLWVRSLGSFFVRRGTPDRSAVSAALATLTRGGAVGIFPEGTRSPDGRLIRLHHGAAYHALRRGVPVLPIGIAGAHTLLPKGVTWPRRGRVVIRIGPPLMVPTMTGPVPQAVQAEWTARFAQALTNLLPPDQRPSSPASPASPALLRNRTAAYHRAVPGLSRDGAISELGGRSYDVLVIGGGITGAAVVCRAAMAGYRVALVDQQDFAGGTSSRSSRLIHGGLRYLRHGQLGVVRAMLVERAKLAAEAPHLVHPLWFLLPLYDGGAVSTWTARSFMALYHGLRPAGQAPAWSHLSSGETIRREPLLRRAGLRGGILYQEFLTHDARLALETVLGARGHGATTVNYVRFVAPLVLGGRTAGGTVEDRLTGRHLDVRARAIVNAGGPWADTVIGRADGSTPRLRLTRGVHIFIPRRRLPVSQGVNILSPRDGRPMAIVPLHECVLVGPTETPFDGAPDGVSADPGDVAYLLESLESYFPTLRLTAHDVIATRAALRPLYDHSARPAGEVSRAYHVNRDAGGVLSVLGGKLTLHRRAAEATVRALAAEIGRPEAASAEPPRWLPGAHWNGRAGNVRSMLREAGVPDASQKHLIGTYGSRSEMLAEYLASHAEDARPIVSGLPILWAEAAWAIADEGAVTSEDFTERRSDLAIRAKAIGAAIPAELEDRWQAQATTLTTSHKRGEGVRR